jgi:hypothetical protein
MIKVRQQVFETNSSSTHSITMCMEDSFLKWKNGEVVFNRYTEEFLPLEAVFEQIEKEHGPDSVESLKANKDSDWDAFVEELAEWDWYTFRSFRSELCYEHFSDSYTTPSGDKVYAFGYYGSDY